MVLANNMTEVLFYITEETKVRHSLTWRIARAAVMQQRHVYIHTASQEEAVYLDKLFWQQPVAGFLPHALLSDDPNAINPVVIGHGPEPGPCHDVLINLAPQTPSFFSRFLRVAELITGDEEVRISGRERWRFYQHQGYPLTSHKIS